MQTWLLVAAERREFDGIVKRTEACSKLDWPAEFACEARFKGDRWWMVANGAGRAAVGRALEKLEKKIEVSGIVSTGFCGALDPALRVGDIVEDGIVCSHRVAVTRSEKAALREKTGGVAVDMESAAVAAWAREAGVPFRSIRAVSDTAGEDLPLDFNLFIDEEGHVARGRIALAAMKNPFTKIPALLRLDRNCRVASEALGEFFVNRGL